MKGMGSSRCVRNNIHTHILEVARDWQEWNRKVGILLLRVLYNFPGKRCLLLAVHITVIHCISKAAEFTTTI
jgi:hypothetical protein